MYMKSKRIKITAISFILAMMTACGKGGAKDDNLVLLEKEAEEPEYGIAAVTRQDLQETVTVRSQYKAVHSDGLSFAVDGKVIEEVYVKEGDKVKKGQLMATLTADSLETQIAELEYAIERAEIMLNQVLSQKELEIAIENAEYEYNYRTYFDAEPHEERLAQIESAYEYTIEDYEDALYIARLKLEELKAQIEDGKLYATMSGTVVYVKPKMEGTLTVADERIFTITDSDECLFVGDKPEDAIYFTEGVPVMMEVITGDNKGTYEVLPYELDKADEEGLRFIMADGDVGKVNIGARGNIVLVLSSREDALCVAPKALHSMDEKYFVYVMKEDGTQETKWVEIGLRTKEYVEILSGLEEGDKVVLR